MGVYWLCSSWHWVCFFNCVKTQYVWVDEFVTLQLYVWVFETKTNLWGPFVLSIWNNLLDFASDVIMSTGLLEVRFMVLWSEYENHCTEACVSGENEWVWNTGWCIMHPEYYIPTLCWPKFPKPLMFSVRWPLSTPT